LIPLMFQLASDTRRDRGRGFDTASGGVGGSGTGCTGVVVTVGAITGGVVGATGEC